MRESLLDPTFLHFAVTTARLLESRDQLKATSHKIEEEDLTNKLKCCDS